MSVATTPLSIDVDPDLYSAVHTAIDESVSDRLLDARELTVRAAVRDVVAREVAPRAASVDRTHVFAHESYQALARAGLGGLLFPKELGGSGDSNVAYAVAVEEIAAGCAATSLIYMTQTHAAYPIWVTGSPELAEKYIPGLLNGAAYGSMAITEPDAGSDMSAISTRATARTEAGAISGYLVSGSKTFITTGDKADVIVCFVTTDPQLGRKGVTALVVEGAQAGVSAGKPFAKMGMHGSSTAELFFSNVDVPVSNRLGDEGDGWGIVMSSVIKSRISAAAQGIGIARGAYIRALAALHRIHGDRLPDDVSFTLAELRGDILRGRLLLWATAREVDQASSPSSAQIGMMKQACTDLGLRVTLAATGLLGVYGDLAVFGVERGIRDSKVTQIYDGTNEIQRLLIGRDTNQRIRGLL